MVCMNIIITIALGVLDNIHNQTVTAGEKANFTCEFSTFENNNIVVFWTVADERYDCETSEQGVSPGDNSCYGDDEQSVLVIENVAMFEKDEILVYCNLDQNLPEEFTSDPSFDDQFSNIIQMGAFLIIIGENSSISLVFEVYIM